MFDPVFCVLKCPYCPTDRGQIVVDLDALLAVCCGTEYANIYDAPHPAVNFGPDRDGAPCDHQVDAMVTLKWWSPERPGRGRRGGAVDSGWWHPMAYECDWDRGEPQAARTSLTVCGITVPTDPLVRVVGADLKGTFRGLPGRAVWTQSTEPDDGSPAGPGDEAGRWSVIADAVYAPDPARLVGEVIDMLPAGRRLVR